MVAGWRGVGKTHFGLAAAYAIATGGEFIGYAVPKPRRVVYVDGEMDPADLQARLAAIHHTAQRDGNGDPSLASNLRILTHADYDLGLPNLADEEGEGRRLIERAVGDADVLMLDNLSTLCQTGELKENDAESWSHMQAWLLRLRRQGKSVLMFHHTGKPDKSGHTSQRGTSKREDVLNTSIVLQPAERGQFTVEFTKSRGFLAPEPFIVRIESGEGVHRLVRVDRRAEIADLLEQGISQKEIAERLHTSEATVSREVRKIKVSRRDSAA